MILHHVAAELDDMRCPCGCGQWADEAHDPNRAWEVVPTTCFVREALGDWIEDHKPGPHVLLGIRELTL